jgi:hypothetical protein
MDPEAYLRFIGAVSAIHSRRMKTACNVSVSCVQLPRPRVVVDLLMAEYLDEIATKFSASVSSRSDSHQWP